MMSVAKFKDLFQGINISNTMMLPAPVFIDRAFFENAKEGVAVTGGDNSIKLIRSEFGLPNNGSVNDEKSGVYLKGTTGYTFEENEFWQYLGGTKDDAGIRIHQNGSFGDQLYRNNFHNINSGVWAQQNNLGVQVKCNDFESPVNDYNIAAVSSPGLPDQGLCYTGSDPVIKYNSPAGNLISHDGTYTDSDFHNFFQNPQLDYNRHSPTQYELIHHFQNLVDDNDCGFGYSETYSCPTLINDGGIADPEEIAERIGELDEALEIEDLEEEEKAWLTKERAIYASRLIQEYLIQDSLYGINTAIEWLENDTANLSMTLLIPLKIHQGNWNEANSLLEDIDLHNDQYEGFYNVHEWIIDKLIADTTYLEATAEEITTLENIVGDSIKYSANAEAILALVDSHEIELVYEPIPDTSSKRGPDSEASDTLDGFAVYPNPAGQLLNISLKGESQANITVYDIHGRKLMEQSLPEGNHHKLDISRLSAGTYILEIIQGQEYYKTSIVVLR